jgi:hypothetical protein
VCLWRVWKYLGVRNPGFTVPWRVRYLGVGISGFIESGYSPLVSAHLVLRFTLESHGTLVAVSAPLKMPLRD